MAESRAVIEYQTKKSLFDIISKEIFCHLCKIVPREPPIYFSSMVKHTYVNTYLEVQRPEKFACNACIQNKYCQNQNTTNLQKFVIICSTCYPKWERSSATEELQPYTLLELLLPALPTFCKFHNNGCKIVMDSTKVIYHEEDCEFRNVSCIYRNCATKIMYKGTNNNLCRLKKAK